MINPVILDKFCNLIRKHHGLVSLFYLPDTDEARAELVERNKDAKIIAHHPDAIVPVYVYEQYEGYFVFKNGMNKSSEDLEQIIQLKELLIDQVVIRNARKKSQGRFENYLTYQVNSYNNVIPFRRR